MTLDAGQFRKRIVIQQQVKTPNASGGASKAWQTVPGCSSVPVQITYPPPSKKGDEVYNQQQVRSGVYVSMTIRYRPSTNIDASMQVAYGTRTFNIRTVLPDDTNQQFITLQCEEVQGKGSLHK